MKLFIRNFQYRQVHRDRKHSSGCRRWEWEWGVTAKGYQDLFGVMEMFQNDGGGGCTSLQIYWKPLYYSLKKNELYWYVNYTSINLFKKLVLSFYPQKINRIYWASAKCLRACAGTKFSSWEADGIYTRPKSWNRQETKPSFAGLKSKWSNTLQYIFSIVLRVHRKVYG